jgi:glutamyl-tRNA reductase
MAAAAVRLATQLFEDLREIKVLFVGAGEMIELVATHFAARTPKAHGAGQPHARARREAGRPLRRRGLRLSDLPNGCMNSTPSFPAPPARCRSSAWAPSNAR